MVSLKKSIAPCLISPSGDFKYLMVELIRKDTKEKYVVVRGQTGFEYHSDIFQEFRDKELTQGTIDDGSDQRYCYHLGNDEFMFYSCGGGYISHDPVAKTIVLSGTSKAFGTADHSVTKRILQDEYTDY